MMHGDSYVMLCCAVLCVQGAASLLKGPLSVTAPLAWLCAFRAEVQRAMDDGRCRCCSLHLPDSLLTLSAHLWLGTSL